MSAPVQNQAASSNTAVANVAADPCPSANTMWQAAKLAIKEDRAIMLDYYVDTHKNTAFLGIDPETSDRILVKSKEEFTSLVKKSYKTEDDFLIVTENSLYVVSGKIQKRKVNLASLQGSYE